MSVLRVHDEQEVLGYYDFIDPEYPTTVYYPGAEGFWQPCIRVAIDGKEYYDWTEDIGDLDEHFTIYVRRRRLRWFGKWRIVSALMKGEPLYLRPLLQR